MLPRLPCSLPPGARAPARQRGGQHEASPAGSASAGEVAAGTNGPGHDHVDLPSAAFGADQLRAPIEHWRFGAVPSGHLGGIGFHLIPAIPAPHDQSDTSRSCVAERHRRAGRGFHCLYGYALGEWSPATSADATELLAIKLTSNVVILTINFLENFMYRWKSPNILSHWLRLLRS